MAGQRNNNNNRNNSNNRSSGGSEKKHSGCKAGFTKKGDPFTQGWNVSKRHGMMSFLAVPYKGSKLVTSKSGKRWLNVMVKVSPEKAQPFIVSGMRNDDTGQVTIQELGMVMNPKAPNGGYCGKF